MINGSGERVREQRDGNLSSIVSQIRDDGPVDLKTAGRRGAAPLDEEPSRGGDAMRTPVFLREADPPSDAPWSEPPRPAPPAAQAQPAPSPERTPQSAKRRMPLLASALLAAALMSGGAILFLYRSPPEAAQAVIASAVDPAIEEEIATVKASIALLSERLETLAGDRGGAGPRGTERTDTAPRELADEAQGRREAELARRLDLLTAQLARLAESAGAQPAPASVGEPASAPDLAAAGATDAFELASGLGAGSAEEEDHSSQHAAVASSATDPAENPPGLTRPQPSLELPVARMLAVDNTADLLQPVQIQDVGPVDATQTSVSPDAAQEQLQGLASVLERGTTRLASTMTDQRTNTVEPVEPDSANTAGSVQYTEATRATKAEDWFINLIAVRGQTAARELQRDYRKHGVEAQVVPIGGGSLYGVRVSGFGSRSEASRQAAVVKAKLGIDEVWIDQR